jgi:hypothetical protein
LAWSHLVSSFIQAIWMGVDNSGELPLEFLPIVTDPEYFSEAEVEQLLHAWWRGSANASQCRWFDSAPGHHGPSKA